MPREIKSLPPEVTRIFFDAGPRKIVLVEGPDDRDVFREWYMERLSEVEFYCAEEGMGDKYVISLLKTLSRHTKRAYGIIDRDFRSDEQVDAPHHNSKARLFILRRYAIENYLLEPEALREELRLFYGRRKSPPDAATIAADLLRLCQQLRTAMAANWVFAEVGGIEHFREGHDISDRALLIQQAAKRLGCDEAEAERRIAEKETLLDSWLTALDTAHCYVNGKHLLQQVYVLYIVNVRRGLLKDHFRNLLTRTVKRLGLHTDIRAIVDQRILSGG